MIKLYEYHLDKGTTFGDCYCSPDQSSFYVNIPKNASTWTNPHFRSLGWKESNFYYQDLSQATGLIALRDPIDRWCSGIAEYLYLYHPTVTTDQLNQFTIDLIFDKVSFDDHTECQVYFVDGLNFDRCVFFWVGDNYSNNLGKYIGQSIVNIPKAYTSDHTTFKKTFKQFFKQHLEKNSKYLEQIKNYFRKDYQLIESVKFYGTR